MKLNRKILLISITLYLIGILSIIGGAFLNWGWPLVIFGMFPVSVGVAIIGMFIKVRTSILAMRKVIEALL